MRGNDAVKVAVLIKRLLLIVSIFRRPVDSFNVGKRRVVYTTG